MVGNQEQGRHFYRKFEELTKLTEQEINVENINQLKSLLTYISIEYKLDKGRADAAIETLKSKTNKNNAK